MEGLQILGVIFIVVALIIFLPLAQIWGLNTLFGLGIGYSFAEWAGMVAVNSIFGASNYSS